MTHRGNSPGRRLYELEAKIPYPGYPAYRGFCPARQTGAVANSPALQPSVKPAVQNPTKKTKNAQLCANRFE